MDLQTVFDNCKNEYDYIFNMIELMAKKINIQVDSNTNPEDITTYFDLILQFSLLQIAVADQDLDSNEIIFIRDLTKKGDFVEFINVSVGGNQFSWDRLYNGGADLLKEFLTGIESTMKDMSKKFVAVFAACDAMVPSYNYVEIFTSTIGKIFDGLCLMDGQRTASELKSTPLIIDVIDMIENLKKMFEKKLR